MKKRILSIGFGLVMILAVGFSVMTEKADAGTIGGKRANGVSDPDFCRYGSGSCLSTVVIAAVH